MIIDFERLRKLGWLDEYRIATLWSVWADTGEPYPMEINALWDADNIKRLYDEGIYWKEMWVEAVREGRQLDTATLVKLEAYPDKYGTYTITINDEPVVRMENPDEYNIDKVFWDAVKEKIEVIAKDWKTFIKWLRENLLCDERWPLFRTKDEAEEYGGGVKALIGMSKEVEDLGLLPDGEDWEDVMHEIGML